MRLTIFMRQLALVSALLLVPAARSEAAKGMDLAPTIASAAAPGDSSGDRSRSPLSFVRGAAAGLGWTSFDFTQDTPNSASDFSSGGLEYTLGLMVNLHRERVLATFEHQGLRVSEDLETITRPGGGVLTNTLEPEERRFAASLAYQTTGPGAGTYRIAGGYRWITVDFVRRDFRLDGTPYPGAPAFMSDHFRLRGPGFAGMARVPVGRWTLVGKPVRFRAEFEGVSLQNADIESRGGVVHKPGGFRWDGRAGLESGRDGWSLFIGWRTAGADIEASSPPFTESDPVRTGTSTIRMNGAVLLLQLGAF